MATHTIEILNIENVTHDVRQYTCTKPVNYQFTPGQATEVALDQEGWRDKKRPFTFTSLPSDHHLEFVIKSYPEHDGVTEQIGKAKPGDQFIIDDAWGAIRYQGPGLFLAGGAGITPFISIIRKLTDQHQAFESRLIFSNKKAEDVILQSYWEKNLGPAFTSVLTQEEAEGHRHTKIDEDFLKEEIRNIHQYFYICGPDDMVEDLSKALQNLGVSGDHIIHEEFE